MKSTVGGVSQIFFFKMAPPPHYLGKYVGIPNFFPNRALKYVFEHLVEDHFRQMGWLGIHFSA